MSVEWVDRPSLREPILVCAFKGWNDAGEAASAAVEFLCEAFDAQPIAAIDSEEYYDFTAVRPTVRLIEGRSRAIDWPENSFDAARVRGADRDLIMLRGVEPSLRWKAFCDDVMEVADATGARMIVTLGALLADVPHSRPVGITGLASAEGQVERLGFERTNYEGPTGIVGVLHAEFANAGMDSISLWAPVPHYVAATPNPKAALALVRGFEGIARVAVDASRLEGASEDYDRQVTAAVASDPDVKAFVEKLEEMADEMSEEEGPPEELPSGDVIAHEFQRFLRQRGPGEEDEI
ncbi:MAG TPA: PAC2 family protein [Thermoleophilaceae bacterium]|jgi:predicted ATP-grasp superfamily ATP-dependent carboligase|nr:PAC2 family protein [Thermoleophilaceae bacterium]